MAVNRVMPLSTTAGSGVVQGFDHLVSVQPGIQIGGRQASKEAVQVAIQEGETVMVQAEALPNAVPDQETAVKNRDSGLITGEELTVYVHLHRGVALVDQSLVGAS